MLYLGECLVLDGLLFVGLARGEPSAVRDIKRLKLPFGECLIDLLFGTFLIYSWRVCGIKITGSFLKLEAPFCGVVVGDSYFGLKRPSRGILTKLC